MPGKQSTLPDESPSSSKRSGKGLLFTRRSKQQERSEEEAGGLSSSIILAAAPPESPSHDHAPIQAPQLSPKLTPTSALRKKGTYSPRNYQRPLEVESNPSMPESVSRFLAKMKLAGRHNDSFDDSTNDGLWKDLNMSAESHKGEGMYYGDFMTSFDAGSATEGDDVRSVSQLSGTQQPIGEPDINLMNSLSMLTRSSGRVSRDENDSLANFGEWTPQDSAYGAACPVCGCLPKKIRRTIEIMMIGFMVFLVVYVVVTASMSITSQHGKDDADNYDYNNGNKLADDDYYIEGWQNDETMTNEDTTTSVDDLFDDTDTNDDDQSDDLNRYLMELI